MSRGGALGPKVGEFRFVECGYDPASGEARLSYAFDTGKPLVERLVFPHAPWPMDASRQAAFQRALRLLHRVAGVSYYKACIPPRLQPGSPRPDPLTADFLERLYVDGLGEFAWANGLSLEGRVHFPRSEGPDPQPLDLALPQRALLAMGGGKDSLVSLDMLRRSGVEIQPACVGGSPLIGETARRAGLPLLRIERHLAPELADMNRAGALNGHVPVTAIHAAILACAAILYGYGWVVFSNERSADEPTRGGDGGHPVNHQYSKSLVFERDWRQVIRRTIAADLECFSLLRPLTELAIAARFARLESFHPVFSSCNRNFHQHGSRLGPNRWCGDCPKCRFATLALAPFLSPKAVTDILGRNLLNEPRQESGFRALCELGADKPFECVGTVGECRAALARLARREDWSKCAIVALLAPELAAVTVPDFDQLLVPTGPHFIPEPLLRRVDL